MKTIELEELPIKQSINLMKYFLKEKMVGWPFHYFLEPQLIIRVNNTKKITQYLRKRKIKYKIYLYPNKGKFRESKRLKSYQTGLIELYSVYSVIALVAKGRRLDLLANRIHHCFLNMLGFEYYDEAKYYLSQAKGYMKYQYKDDGKPTTYITYLFIKLLHKIL